MIKHVRFDIGLEPPKKISSNITSTVFINMPKVYLGSLTLLFPAYF